MTRKTLLSSALCGAAILSSSLLHTSSVKAHEDFEIDVTGGYHFGTRITADQEGASGENLDSEGEYRLDGSFAFSVIGGYRIQPNGFIYLSYTRQATDMEYTPSGATDGDSDILTGTPVSGRASVEYYQFGGNIEMTRGIFVPYMGFSVGLSRFAALDGDSSRIFFAAAFDSGVKIDLHKNVHLRFLGRVPMVFTTNELYCGSAGGCIVTTKVRPSFKLSFTRALASAFRFKRVLTCADLNRRVFKDLGDGLEKVRS